MKSAHEDNRGMLFGILEARDGRIWVGALGGVYHSDGKTMTEFRGDQARK